jgi:hydrophobic/amphiphilic exporter-1 (mainly G- bacteria), HAE1 family
MLTKLFVTRPTLAAVLVALLLIGGVLAALNLRIQELPNVDVPHVVIILFYPAASPAEMNDSIVRPIEDQLAGAPNLEHLQSAVQQGFATVTAEFSLNSKRTDDLVEVQRRVQAVQSLLPPDLSTPTIETFDPGEADVVSLAVGSSMAAGRLSSLITNQVVPAIEQIPGIGHVQAYGIVTPSIQVEVDPKKLNDQKLTLPDIVNAIAVNNVRAPGGILYGTGRETGINIRGDILGSEGVAALPIPIPVSNTAYSFNPLTGALVPPPPPKTVRVSDVAVVRDTNEPQRIYAFTNGWPSLILQVQKSTGASEVDAAQALLRQLPELRQRFPEIAFTVLDDRSLYTGHQVWGVVRTLGEGIVLVAIVMLLFLRSWRNAAAVLVAIPTSLFATLLVMRIGNFTLDTVSLLAMTLITGILVDDSIVVLENTQRHREAGETPTTAAVNGRLEIGLAAIVITLVDVVVFLPIAFLPGIVGRFLSEFAVVVVVATLSSLLVSFTVTPALAGNWSLLSQGRGTKPFAWFASGFERLRALYAERVLPWSLAHGVLVASIALVTLAGAIALVPLGVVGFEFDPAQDVGEIFVQLNYPSGTPLEKTRHTVREIEQQINTLDEVRSESTVAGASMSPVGGFIVDAAVGQIDVHLKNGHRHSTDYWVAQLRGIAERLAPGAQPVVIPATNTNGGSIQPIDYLVTNSGGDPSLPAQKVYDALRQTPGAINVYSSAASLAPQLDITFDRVKARKLDVSIQAAAIAIRAAFGGVRATQFEGPEGLKDVQVIYPPAYQRNQGQLEDIPLRATTGDIVHVRDIARLAYTYGPRIINRVERQTVVHVSANVASGVALSNVEAGFLGRLTDLHLPASVHVAANGSGNQQNLNDTVSGMTTALVLALLLVFLLMVALYNSYVSPLIIMFSVPLAVVGALGALALTRETLNAFSLIGTVLLIGLVSKNGILLVDYANQLRERGMDRLAAIRESARIRFRPIVMTTVAMVTGMLPLALALDPAVMSRRSLGIVVIGGLTSSLLLTLVIIPIVYVWLGPRMTKRALAPTELRSVSDEAAQRKAGTAL